MAPHAKLKETPLAPKPLHSLPKLDTAEDTPHDESAAHYIIPNTTNRKNDDAKITVTRHLPHTTQVSELTAPNVLITHRRHDERYTMKARGTAATTLYTWPTWGTSYNPPSITPPPGPPPSTRHTAQTREPNTQACTLPPKRASTNTTQDARPTPSTTTRPSPA